MKYKLLLKEGFDVLLEGEMAPPKSKPGDYPRASESREMDKRMLDFEMAVNANTRLRLHVERVED